jgi:hypothetical protein
MWICQPFLNMIILGGYLSSVAMSPVDVFTYKIRKSTVFV